MDNLLQCMKIVGDDTIQRTQLKHRLQLVKAFEIEKGMKVLEIGCGQGDTTVALADAVGEHGHILAIDIAPRNYGEPVTLGEATDTIKQSALGERITFQFETDFLNLELSESYDVVVLSHCSWYFKNPDMLLHYFKKIKTLAKRICFAEWDLDYTLIPQRAHFCAANILALYAAFYEDDGNIQNLFHKTQIKHLLIDAGFTMAHEQTVDATYLQDGGWEIDFANYVLEQFKQTPTPIHTLVQSFAHLMNDQTTGILSLNSFVISAHS
ncbi:class I SAM-dependent methyltransferase [Lysinibacillus sp. 2017]|uniref:SAM-dependent methyltransferase n=1 Tax=unclassified Lysinibacillus TaxID=2636778 RepID=UPI000D52850D|nr:MULTISPECIES: class I SAM-dependent methyltransferase [unclassified Lysinibacillus]AWE07571.1 class I SAM-dependent methyltransferase [Lysinibacillus sp. 2017]TGN36735.1 class I SAM-dependent methyltransferase [Lysinibacillus sp. S2017]